MFIPIIAPLKIQQKASLSSSILIKTLKSEQKYSLPPKTRESIGSLPPSPAGEAKAF